MIIVSISSLVISLLVLLLQGLLHRRQMVLQKILLNHIEFQMQTHISELNLMELRAYENKILKSKPPTRDEKAIKELTLQIIQKRVLQLNKK